MSSTASTSPTDTYTLDIQHTAENVALRSIVLHTANKYLDIDPDMKQISSVTLSDLFTLIDTIVKKEAAAEKRKIELSPKTERKEPSHPSLSFQASVAKECQKAGICDPARISAIAEIKWHQHGLDVQ